MASAQTAGMAGGSFSAGQTEGVRLPLVVDLDGTLIKTDTLYESFVSLAIRRPILAAKMVVVLLRRGRAAVKADLAKEGGLDSEKLPLRDDFVAWLQGERAAGRELHLVSAADQQVVNAVAGRLKIFASAKGSSGDINLKAERKADYLQQRFPAGFAYAGNSRVDLAVWKQAQAIILAGVSGRTKRAAEGLGKPIEAIFSGQPRLLKPLLQELRLHQWSKNALVFVPVILAHEFFLRNAWVQALLAFFALGICASATYIINDIVDLSADRRHATKCRRPIASGVLPLPVACLMVPLLLAVGTVFAANASFSAVLVLFAYITLTLAYSFRLKRVPLLDTAIIGVLFSLRIVMGCAATATSASPWLLAFSMMLFFSLAMAKRQTDLVKDSRAAGHRKMYGRGYTREDVTLSLVYGVTSGVASLVILMLYTTNSVAAGLYHRQEWLWGVPLLLYLWQMRIWLLAHRGHLDDDPIMFALKDYYSILLGAGCAVLFYMAL